ncbi:MAG: dNTP triphosphohydrolase [Dehalococcoidia bacterium]|nr:dNTP triphosphohydrolase [Dehalococcoidia bacterium]
MPLTINSPVTLRDESRHEADRVPDNRLAPQRDRDRILFTTAFRRLDGTSQVAAASEAHVFHNRLTHTLEVAQISRRLAELLIREQGELLEAVGGLDPETAEAAAFAHDLGHPPFGHLGEEELCRLVEDHNPDGFEGNAQSFRIVTKLAVRNANFRGLNLTRATLNGILKYPWLRASDGQHRRKFGAYRSEQDDFEWARVGAATARSAEAEVMNWADDVAYSVHDLYDFFRAGLIPLERLALDEAYFRKFIEELLRYWAAKDSPPSRVDGAPFARDDFDGVWSSLFAVFPIGDRFNGSRDHRAQLRSYTSMLISRYVKGADDRGRPLQLREPTSNDPRVIRIEEQAELEVILLKELTAHYVIRNRALASLQHGQRQVIRDLFQIFQDDITHGGRRLIPDGAAELLDEELEGVQEPENRVKVEARVVADIISGLTESQAAHMHQRLSGVTTGSVLDFLP